MTQDRPKGALLALDAAVRQTGWAVFSPGQQVTTGMIGIRGRRGIDAPARLALLADCLDRLVEGWRPGEVAHSRPSGIHWSVPALELLEEALLRWSQRHGLKLYSYTTQEVRTAVTGRPNTPKDELAYAVMAGLGLIGAEKSANEWEAIAVGRYHLARRRAEKIGPEGRSGPSGDNAAP